MTKDYEESKVNYHNCTNLEGLVGYETKLINRIHQRYKIKEDIDSFALKVVNQYAARIREKYCRIRCYEYKDCYMAND